MKKEKLEPTVGRLGIITPENRHLLPVEVQDILGKLERHELVSPKYPIALKDYLKRRTRERLQENPNLHLKEVVLQSVQSLPDWLPPVLVKDAVSWVVEEWESCTQNQEHLAAAGSGGSGQ